jgi:hypothetical protein
MKNKMLGNFKHIESKLIQLSSGDWRRKSLCGPAGSPDERKSCHGILHQAIYGKNGRVLWQVDVDEQSGVVKQLVKGKRANLVYRGRANFCVISLENWRCERGKDDSNQFAPDLLTENIWRLGTISRMSSEFIKHIRPLV